MGDIIDILYVSQVLYPIGWNEYLCAFWREGVRTCGVCIHVCLCVCVCLSMHILFESPVLQTCTLDSLKCFLRNINIVTLLRIIGFDRDFCLCNFETQSLGQKKRKKICGGFCLIKKIESIDSV